MIQLKKDALLSNLPVDDPKAKMSVLYEGIDSVISGWNDYWEDCGYRLMTNMFSLMHGDTERYEVDQNHNDFTILVNAYNEEVKAIRSFGRHHIKADSFLFHTPYIPLSAYVPTSKEELTERIRMVKEIFDKEITTIKEKFQKPVFLIKRCGINNYLGWSLNEGKCLFVYNYKVYNDNFQIIEGNGQRELKKISDKSDYEIIPPSEQISYEMGLEIDAQELTFGLNWKNKKLKEKQKLADPSLQDIYDKAICLINARRQNQYEDNDKADIFFKILERLVAQFEKQNAGLSLPSPAVLKEIFPPAVLEKRLQRLRSDAEEIAEYVEKIDELDLKKRA